MTCRNRPELSSLSQVKNMNHPSPLVGLFLGPLLGLSMLAGCSTLPHLGAPATRLAQGQLAPAIVESESTLGVEAKPDVKTTESPENKSLPEPIINIEDNNVFFDPGSTTVNDAEKAKLRQHANRLKQNPKKYVTLTGHSDEQGSRNYKLAIAEERLVVVSKLLRSFGVSSRQIRRNRSASVKNSPACSTTDCLRLHRRVELVYPK